MIRVYSKPHGCLRIHEVNTNSVDEAREAVIEQVYSSPMFEGKFAVLAVVPLTEKK